MSVRTSADEALDRAEDNITAAIREIYSIVVDHCGGHDSYSSDYTARIREVFHGLIDLQDKLRR